MAVRELVACVHIWRIRAVGGHVALLRAIRILARSIHPRCAGSFGDFHSRSARRISLSASVAAASLLRSFEWMWRMARWRERPYSAMCFAHPCLHNPVCAAPAVRLSRARGRVPSSKWIVLDENAAQFSKPNDRLTGTPLEKK